jgi:MFS family permease
MAMENVRTTRRRSFFVNRNFAMLWIGGTIARLSEGLLFAAFALWILDFIAKDQPLAPPAIKGIEVMALLALFILGPIAGVFIDRWKDQRRVLLITSALRAVTALVPIVAALLLSSTPPHSPGMVAFALISIYLAIFVVSTLTHFSIPASYVLFVDCVREEDYSYANGLLLTTSFMALMLGTPLGVLLFFTIGFPGAILFDGLLYVVTFIATTFIDIKGDVNKQVISHEGFIRSAIKGVSFCLKNSLITILLFTLVLINVWNGALTMLGGTFLTQNLHTAYPPAPLYATDGLYGYLGFSIGIAFAVGSLLFGLIARRTGEKRVFSYSLLFAGLLMLVVSRITQLIPAIGVIVLISLLTAGVNVVAVPVYLWVTPRHFLGRVRAAVDVLTNLASVGSGVLCYWLLGSVLHNFHVQFYGITFTPVDTVFTVTGIICVAGGIFVVRALSNPSKPGLNTAETVDEQSADTVRTTPEPTMIGKF